MRRGSIFVTGSDTLYILLLIAAITVSTMGDR